MKTAARNALGCLLAALPAIVAASPPPFAQLAQRCSPDVHPITLAGLIMTESSWNPYAIGVVGGRLARQPASLAEAVATARGLERRGFNFSMGYGQINRAHLAKFGPGYQALFEPCNNLRASSAILKECFVRAKGQQPDDQHALRAALSCYYSGDFKRGFQSGKPGAPSYVQKVVANAILPAPHAPLVPAVLPLCGEDRETNKAAPSSTIHARIAGRPQSSQTQTMEWVIFADRSLAQKDPTEQQSALERPIQISESSLPPRKIGALGDVERNRPVRAERKLHTPIRNDSPRETEETSTFVQFVP